MKAFRLAALVVLSFLLAACATTDSAHSPVSQLTVAGDGNDLPSKKQIYDACLPIETKIALAGSETKPPKSLHDASVFSHFICSVSAELCAKDPNSPACQKTLKDYGLLK